ncbi:MAG TPA: glycosyltransferase [Candidatus Limnocylindrales bacterium]|nr:glycosyltransferase [Candidatus Limnocylindrales bacterium]
MTEPPAEAPSATPQRAVLVLPSTAEFDSRPYRIASALAARGHTVTVLARWRAGLPTDERHPAGYAIRRVPVDAIDGLPFPGAVRAVRDGLRRLDARRGRGRATAPSGGGGGATPGPGGPDDGGGRDASTPRSGVLRRFGAGVIRRLAIQLTVRSQARASRRVCPPADLIHGMAYMGIPIALGLGRRRRIPVVYDARDIYLDAGNLARLTGPMRWLVGRAERGWARRADRVITVNRPYAEVMAGRWSVDFPLIVMNCSYRYEPPSPRERRFHDALRLDPATRVVIYQGGFSRDRGIEQLIAAIPDVPGATLVLLGYGSLQAELERVAADPATGGRVRVMAAVQPTELLGWIASADVVAMPIQPTTLNHRLTTPNKLFEALAAGVPVVASDLPGMAPIVRETGCGRLVDPTDPAAIASALREVLDTPEDEMAAWRARCAAAARETYNWERQMEVLLVEYGRLTGRPW